MKNYNPNNKSFKFFSALGIGILITLLNFIAVALLDLPPKITWIVYLGYGFWFCGLMFWILSMFQLKKLSNYKANYMNTVMLVEKGIYSFIRHPQYLGFMLFDAGFICKSQHWAIAIASFTAIVFLYFGAKEEEKILINRFPNHYLVYMKEVPSFNLFIGLFRKLTS